jgi:hypothetical protein
MDEKGQREYYIKFEGENFRSGRVLGAVTKLELV